MPFRSGPGRDWPAIWPSSAGFHGPDRRGQGAARETVAPDAPPGIFGRGARLGLWNRSCRLHDDSARIRRKNRPELAARGQQAAEFIAFRGAGSVFRARQRILLHAFVRGCVCLWRNNLVASGRFSIPAVPCLSCVIWWRARSVNQHVASEGLSPQRVRRRRASGAWKNRPRCREVPLPAMICHGIKVPRRQTITRPPKADYRQPPKEEIRIVASRRLRPPQ